MFDSKEYKRSRISYTLECAFEYFVTILIGDSFLAHILTSLGMSDALTGIISSFASLAFLIQLISVPIVRKITNTKRFAVLFHTFGQLCFMILYLIPFFSFGEGLSQPLACALILLGYFGNYFVSSLIYRWGNSFVWPQKRASFSSRKEMISLASGVIVQLAAGYIVDFFIGLDNKRGAFLFVAISIFVFCASDLVCLLLIKNDIVDKTRRTKSAPFREVLKNTLGNKNFRHVVILVSLIKAAQYAVTGFLGTYKINNLMLSMTLIQAISIGGCLCRFFVSVPFGKYTDRTSFSKGIQLGLIISAVGFAILTFTSPSSWWLIFIYAALYDISRAGTNANTMNICYSYVDMKYFTEAFSIMNAIAGIVGFLTSLVCGKLLSLVQTNGLQIFGANVYGQQLLAFISFTIVIIAIVYNKLVVGKQKIQIQ